MTPNPFVVDSNEFSDTIAPTQHTLTPMTACDEHGIFVWVNDAFTDLVGYSHQELIGKPAVNFITPETVSPTLETISHLNAGKSLVELVNVYQRKDGSKVKMYWRGNRDPNTGFVYGVVKKFSEETVS